MKRFVETVFAIKMNACLCFTALMLVLALVELIGGFPLLSVGRVFQVLVLSLICSGLQYLFFSGETLKNWSRFWRLLAFKLLLLGTLCGFAVGFRWFPVEELRAWLVFLAVFAVAFLGLLAGFEVMFRITGRRYTGLLGERQNQK